MVRFLMDAKDLLLLLRDLGWGDSPVLEESRANGLERAENRPRTPLRASVVSDLEPSTEPLQSPFRASEEASEERVLEHLSPEAWKGLVGSLDDGSIYGLALDGLLLRLALSRQEFDPRDLITDPRYRSLESRVRKRLKGLKRWGKKGGVANAKKNPDWWKRSK